MTTKETETTTNTPTATDVLPLVTEDTTGKLIEIIEQLAEDAPKEEVPAKPKRKRRAKKEEVKVVLRGQSAEAKGMEFGQFNTSEQRIMAVLDPNGSGTRTILTLNELVAATGWQKKFGAKRGNSKVRNALRRLVREGFVEHPVDLKDGQYRMSQRGRNAANKAKSAAPVKAPRRAKAVTVPVVETPVFVEAQPSA